MKMTMLYNPLLRNGYLNFSLGSMFCLDLTCTERVVNFKENANKKKPTDFNVISRCHSSEIISRFCYVVNKI